MLKDYYKILNLKNNCSKEEIRKKYKELSKIYHPDKTNNNNNERFLNIKEAYDNLYDEELRKKHNIYLIFEDDCKYSILFFKK